MTHTFRVAKIYSHTRQKQIQPIQTDFLTTLKKLLKA